MTSQLVALALLLALMGGLLFLFLRSGSKIKPDPDRKIEDWPNITQGGSGDTS
ncbi:hypothetical protein IVB33_32785 [Bradyrhizobium sp. 24]|jgi:hypothetical protein|uniref:hypothetical protein n=1 Tax=unclassified Bradyrhizobium TaxID=2631580 RepID=UPI001FFBC129|nr:MULTISPECIES: hypothetical protein [unclassified Bradyrhizobium]MCK1297994.1 hypothetical protein [Bradyrhizobium sp. 37]MCK1381527.1 hypothetical protein [Bradyrhizobium sp. 24]MCK1771398.1 hypothetical protein [Bradyrhizobium sp. 134]UPJ43228.1 hypothetical protein IVB40_03890 [Bradyrhizobium sp. 40]